VTFEEQYAEFVAVRDRYDALIRDLDARMVELEERLNRHNANYENAIKKDIDHSNASTRANVKRYTGQRDEDVAELINVKERIRIAKNVKDERLRDLLPALKQSRDITIKEAQRETEDKTALAYAMKAKFLLFIRSLNEPRTKAATADAQFREAARSCGVEVRRDFFGISEINVSSTYSSSPVAPTQNEINEAFKLGKVPCFVRWYEMTGEILPEDEAYQKLAELKRKERK